MFQREPDLKRLFPKIVQMNDKNELEWEVDRDMLQVNEEGYKLNQENREGVKDVGEKRKLGSGHEREDL